jgi:hypothetical protein
LVREGCLWAFLERARRISSRAVRATVHDCGEIVPARGLTADY